MSSHHEALARTTLLLNEELFAGEADERAIADGLLGTTVRLTADEDALSCRAGQTAFITAFMLVARLGLAVELAAPNVPVIDLVAPLRLPDLVSSLEELGGDLVPGADVRTHADEVDETFALGRAVDEGASPVHVSVTDLTTDLRRGTVGPPCSGDLPLGGFAAGAAIAALALEAALPQVEARTGLASRRPRPTPGPPARIALQELFPELDRELATDVGAMDAVSGGAITHALLYCLLRIPGLRSRVRVIEEQRAELSNVNRYALLRASDAGYQKVEQLEQVATPNLKIEGVASLFTRETRDRVLPFAERVVVGVDNVESRWRVQEDYPAWLAVGATGNHLAQLTTHVAGRPCAACLHAVPLPAQTIPSISFVSFWAGLLQACALLSGSRRARNIVVYPFALGGPSALACFVPAPNSTCPIGCPASRTAGEQVPS